MSSASETVLPADGQDADVLVSGAAGGKVIRGSAWRGVGGIAGSLAGVVTAALLLRHLGVDESGRYVTVISLVAIPVVRGRPRAQRQRLPLSWRCAAPTSAAPLIANILGQRLVVMPVDAAC